MIKAVYTGTFDPVTNGHLDIIERASKMYDVLYVTIFINPHKTCLFTVEERMKMLREATKQFPNVVIDESSSLAVEYAREVGAQVLVRGLRATEDYNYESLMCFIMTRLAYTFVSSSFVKEIVSHKHSVEGLVPACVEEKLIEKYRG